MVWMERRWRVCVLERVLEVEVTEAGSEADQVQAAVSEALRSEPWWQGQEVRLWVAPMDAPGREVVVHVPGASDTTPGDGSSVAGCRCGCGELVLRVRLADGWKDACTACGRAA